MPSVFSFNLIISSRSSDEEEQSAEMARKKRNMEKEQASLVPSYKRVAGYGWAAHTPVRKTQKDEVDDLFDELDFESTRKRPPKKSSLCAKSPSSPSENSRLNLQAAVSSDMNDFNPRSRSNRSSNAKSRASNDIDDLFDEFDEISSTRRKQKKPEASQIPILGDFDDLPNTRRSKRPRDVSPEVPAMGQQPKKKQEPSPIDLDDNEIFVPESPTSSPDVSPRPPPQKANRQNNGNNNVKPEPKVLRRTASNILSGKFCVIAEIIFLLSLKYYSLSQESKTILETSSRSSGNYFSKTHVSKTYHSGRSVTHPYMMTTDSIMSK